MLTFDEIIEFGFVEDEAVVIEPREVFNSAVVGVSVDGCHLIYSYDLAAEALLKSYGEDGSYELQDAFEDLAFNTLRALEYTPAEFRPVIVHC